MPVYIPLVVDDVPLAQIFNLNGGVRHNGGANG